MTLTVRNARIHLIDKGEGEPVLFLHGNPDSSEMWSGIIAKLSPHYRCLAPDLPGFGHSGVPADLDCSLMGMAQFVDDMMEATGVGQPVHLVVHDFGGPYGLAWAVRHPHKVRSITAMNTVFFSDYEWHGLAKILRGLKRDEAIVRL